MTLGVALALCGPGSPVAAQIRNPHGLGAGPRPLHVRMAEAEQAALVEVRRIDTGRIQAVRVAGLFGDVPESFEIKRAPSRPPGVVQGDWMLALMRGERSPFVLVDHKDEVAVVPESDRAAWLVELPEIAALVRRGSGADRVGAALLSHYERWIDEGPESLRKLALRSLLDPAAPFAPLGPEFAARRVAAALDPDRDPTAQAGSAFAATLAAGGATRLLAALDTGSDVAPEVVVVALQGGLRIGSPETAAALARLLGHPDGRVRARAVEMATAVDREHRLLERVEAMASDDPDVEVRRSAEAALRRYGRSGRPSPHGG